MNVQRNVRRLTRRELLASGTAFGTALVVGAGFVAHPGEAWAAEVTALKPETFATLVVMARDTAEQAPMVEEGIATLNTMAVGAGHPSYAGAGWEADRVGLLRRIEQTPFFQAVRGGMMVGLYNNPEVWPHFGYEGESFSKGGYLDRGFNDIDWL